MPLFLRALLLLSLLCPAAVAAAPTPPVKIIFDTDMDGDCDDVAALTLLHILADRGEAEILATIQCGLNDFTPMCLDAINTYHGRGDLPIGRPRLGSRRDSLFTKAVAASGSHDLKSVDDTEEATTLYRRLLTAQPDQSVVIVTVGWHTNLAALLKLPAEGDRPSGLDLVRKKVKLWVCMGGNFIGSPAKDDLKLGNRNFEQDKEAAHHAIHHWPGRILFAGREVCSVPSGLKIGSRFNELPHNHPVRVGYEAYFKGQTKDRHVADLVAVLVAVRGPGELWDVHDQGSIELERDMTFRWNDANDKDQAYLLKRKTNGRPNDRDIEKLLEGLVMTPPKKRAAQ